MNRSKSSVLTLLAVMGLVACSSAERASTRKGTLELATLSGHTYSYTVGPTALVTTASTDGAATAIARAPTTITAGSSNYTVDALGRVVSRDDLTLTYGPDGQVSRASRGGTSVDYIYDEDGLRLAKKGGATVLTTYTSEAAILDDVIVEPLQLAGHLVGAVTGGAFHPVLADRRGTPIADQQTSAVPSPYGQRASRLAIGAAIDYAGQPYDGDLGAVRMGVRDYDPALGSFLQPDPRFLEHPESCIDSPAECNLLAYGRSNPIDYIDPTGTEGESPQGDLKLSSVELEVPGHKWEDTGFDLSKSAAAPAPTPAAAPLQMPTSLAGNGLAKQMDFAAQQRDMQRQYDATPHITASREALGLPPAGPAPGDRMKAGLDVVVGNGRDSGPGFVGYAIMAGSDLRLATGGGNLDRSMQLMRLVQPLDNMIGAVWGHTAGSVSKNVIGADFETGSGHLQLSADGRW
jgi:RHS repeat-associated protein